MRLRSIDNASFAVDENAARRHGDRQRPRGRARRQRHLHLQRHRGRPGRNVFAIDNSGNITVADGSQLNFEAQSVYTLTVQVTDDDANSDTATVTDEPQ